jgi:hypothetical protein
MKANELRIGNLVQVDNIPVRVLWFDYDGAVCESLDKKDMVQMHIEPIPLTEEWLIKFGFMKPKNPTKGFENSFSKGSFIWTEHRFYLDAGNDEGWIIDEYKIEYVHQLQNLYFTLTGEELEIK